MGDANETEINLHFDDEHSFMTVPWSQRVIDQAMDVHNVSPETFEDIVDLDEVLAFHRHFKIGTHSTSHGGAFLSCMALTASSSSTSLEF